MSALKYLYTNHALLKIDRYQKFSVAYCKTIDQFKRDGQLSLLKTLDPAFIGIFLKKIRNT